MEGLVKGLEGVEIDEVEEAEVRRFRRAATVEGDNDERSQSDMGRGARHLLDTMP
jgi:hypothetical protein